MSKPDPNSPKRGNQAKLDTATLCNELVSVSDWCTLGLYLGVKDYELDQIETSHPTGGCGRWKQETFSLWLRCTPNASWGDVVGALRQMGENTLAERIELKYIMGPQHAIHNTLHVTSSSSQELQPVLRHEHSSSQELQPVLRHEHSSSQELQSVLRHEHSSSQELQPVLRSEHSNTNTTNGTNAAVLCRQPPFQELSPSEKEELKIMLNNDVRKMKHWFGWLVTMTRDSVEKRISVVKFSGSILDLGAYEPATEGREGPERPKRRDRPLLDEYSEEIKRAKTVSEIFVILSAYWNYLNLEHLEYIIDLYGTSDDKERLKSYKEELYKFCKRRIFELPLPESCSGNGSALSPKQEKFNVKFDVHKNTTCEDICEMKRIIAGILHVRPAVLNIVRVDAGCVQITFLIPKFVAKEIFPLSGDQASALSKDAAVIRLKCGDYLFDREKPEASLPETEFPLLESEPPLSETKLPPLETEHCLPETEPPQLETKGPPLETEPPQLETKGPPLETEPLLLETKAPLLETEPPQLETEHCLPENEPPQLETEPPLLETEPPPLETEPPPPEIEPPPLEIEPPPPETEPPPPETEPPPPETEPPPQATEPPPQETKPPPLETKPPQLETKPPQLETEPPLPESEIAALKKKAGPSKPSPSTSGVRQHTFKFLHKALPNESGGYDCEFVDPPPKVLKTKCPICLHVLRKPKQTDCCGQIFCETCIEPVQACPMCNKTDFSTFHDKKLQRALNELQVRCTYQERGCTWTGELGKLDKHFNWGDLASGCKFADIQCEFGSVGCKTEMTYQDMMVHMEEEKSYHIQLLAEKVKDQNSEINQLQSELQNSKELLLQIQQQVRRVAPHLPSHDEKFHQLMQESRELTQLLDTPISELVQKSLQTAKPSQRISADFSFIMEDFDLHKRTNAEWYSKPFHTHPRGYKMCVRIDANGYEWVKGTHVSLYTCMLKGEYDDELSWPFRGEIAVELLSQDATHTEGNHYTIQYDDNVRDRFARRVSVGERSPGWGNHTFLPRFKLEPYLKDDCLKFQVHIEL